MESPPTTLLEILTFVVVVLVAGFEFYKWYRDKQFKADTEARHEMIATGLAGLKAEHEKKHTIHKVQFEKEFQVYEDLWETMVKTTHTTTTFERYISGIADIIKKKEVYAGRIKEAQDFAQKSTEIVFCNKPFYLEDIYNLCVDVNKHCLEHLVYLIGQFKKGIFVNKNDASNLLRVIDPIMSQIDKAIQEQIGFIKKAKIVE